MGNKILGGVLFLVGVALALFFCAGVFHHGYDEGVYRLRHLGANDTFMGFGAVAFLIAGIVAATRRSGK